MNNLVKKIESLKKSKINNVVNNRIKEFEKINKNSNVELFKEICFCVR